MVTTSNLRCITSIKFFGIPFKSTLIKSFRSLTTSVMSHMNMEGKKGTKIGFKDTSLYNIIRGMLKIFT